LVAKLIMAENGDVFIPKAVGTGLRQLLSLSIVAAIKSKFSVTDVACHPSIRPRGCSRCRPECR
jgi:hypothetical protein